METLTSQASRCNHCGALAGSGDITPEKMFEIVYAKSCNLVLFDVILKILTNPRQCQHLSGALNCYTVTAMSLG